MQGEQTAVSALPSGASSALETLRLQRLQKQDASDALPNSVGPAPIQNTLPSEDQSDESAPMQHTLRTEDQSNKTAPMQDTFPTTSSPMQEDADKLSAPVQDTLADPVSNLRDHAALTVAALPDQAADATLPAPMQDTLPQASGASTSPADAAPTQDTLADRAEDMPAHHALHSSNVSHRQPVAMQQHHMHSDSHAATSGAPVSDTLEAAHGAEGRMHDEDDDLIRQAMADTAGKDAAGPDGVMDEDSELLQQLLEEA